MQSTTLESYEPSTPSCPACDTRANHQEPANSMPTPPDLFSSFWDPETLVRAEQTHQRQVRCVAQLFFMLGGMALCMALAIHLLKA